MALWLVFRQASYKHNRSENAKFILGCKQSNLSREYILQTLGKPNEIRDVYKGTQVLYYYYDARTLSKGQDGPFACLYVYFHFPEGQNVASAIDEGDTDL